MVDISTELQTEVDGILSYGERLRLKYYNTSYGAGSYYDDDVTLTQSGSDLWTSGLIFPVKSTSDGILLQQGKILLDDKKVFIKGSVQTSGLGPIKIGMNGSPPTQEYQVLNQGEMQEWNLGANPIYKKIYVRYLTNGSFIGE